MIHTNISFSLGDGSMGWSGTPFDPDPPRFPFAWPDEDKSRAIIEREFPPKPGQVVVCSREGDYLRFSMRELKGVYYYYTPLKTVYNPRKKLLW
jgi:hypothetical protein